MENITYFISHSASDKELAGLFYDYYINSLGLPRNSVFCASISEQIPLGTDYLKYIKNAIMNTKNGTVIAIITSSFMQSDFCKYEIGAAWILGIPIHPILFPPINYNDSHIQGSPLAVTQALRIDKYKIRDTMFEVLTRLVASAQDNKELNEYISRISESARMAGSNNITNKIVELISRVEETRIHINILTSSCGVYHKDGNEKTLKVIKDNDEQSIKMQIDFNSCAETNNFFAGYYVRPILPKNWMTFIENKFSLRFDAYSSETIKSLKIEIKGVHYQIADKYCDLYAGSWRTYGIYLGEQNPLEEEWSVMKEICFVVEPEFLSDPVGEVKIKNLRLEKEPRH